MELLDERPTTLRDYLEVLWRRKWVVVIALIVVPLVALVMSLREPSLYRASAVVLVNAENLAASLQNIPDSSQFDRDRNMRTQVALARVPTVAQQTIDAVGLKGWAPSDLLGISSVYSQDDLMTFSVTSRDRALSAALATEYARQFTRYRSTLDTESLKAARRAAERRMAALKRKGGEDSALYALLVEREQQLETLQTLQTARAVLVRPATGAGQVQPTPRRNALFGVALGLFLGLGLVVLLEALDPHVRSAESIAERLGLRLLARIPGPASREVRRRGELVALVDPNGPDAEAFRILKTNIDFVVMQEEAQTILVTSAVEREGKSTTIANLAVALARAGRHVVLVDLDLRSAMLHRFFDLSPAPGLTDVVLRGTSLQEALVPIEISAPRSMGDWDLQRSEGKLEVLPAGTPPSNPGEFVARLPIGPILEYLKGKSDVILIDGPPLLRVGDAMALSAAVDALVVVARINVVTSPMLRDLSRILRDSPASKLGLAVTGANHEPGYRYGYFSYPQDRGKAAI